MDQVGEKAKQADLPHDVRLVATVARLLDLHIAGGSAVRDRPMSRNSRRSAPPLDITCGSDYRLFSFFIAARRMEAAGLFRSPGFTKSFPELSASSRPRLEYCLSFLSLEREIRYLDPPFSGGRKSPDADADAALEVRQAVRTSPPQ